MSERDTPLVSPDDERVLQALKVEQSLQVPAQIYSTSAVLSSLAIEELRSYHRSWNHPLGFVLKG